MEPDKLSSWKEIATFLRVDIKTAQRWEKQRGLPVKRIPGGRRGSVYAIPGDIEEWLRSADVEEPEQEPEREPGLEHAAAAAPRSWISNRKFWIAGLAGATVVAVAVLILMRGRGAEISSAEVRGQTLSALDKRGNALWSFELEQGDRPVQPEEGWRDALRTVRWRRGSRPEVVAAIYQDKATGPETRVLCFDSRGRIRWQWNVGFPLLDFNGQPFEKNWGLEQILPDESGEETVIWAAVVNPFRWASGLFRLDSEGRTRLQFANAGSVMRVLRLPRSAGAKLLVAGVNNAWSRPFVAEIHADGPPAFSPPSGNNRYHFAEDPKGLPVSYFLLPNSEIHRAGNVGYFHVRNLFRLDNRIVVEVVDVKTAQSVFVYEFDLNLTPLKVRTTASGVGVHLRYEANGEIKHRASECPEMTGTQVLRRWTAAGGWTEVAVPVAGQHTLQ